MNCPGCGMFVTDSFDRCPYCGTPLHSVGSSNNPNPSGKGVKIKEFMSSQGGTEEASFDKGGIVFCSEETEQMSCGENVYEDCVNGVLEISCIGKPPMAWNGSGYLISTKGYAITNAHVAAEPSGKAVQYGHMFVMICGEKVKAKVIALADNKAGSGTGVDLALIKLDSVPRKAVPLRFADYSEVKNGAQVYVIGNSLGDGTCITAGIISDRSRMIGQKRLLMTDCAINGGNSGGPIFNEEGLVIGTICAHRIDPNDPNRAIQGMNYAIPSDTVMAFIGKCKISLD